MANKRMFTMKICDSDAFLDMPLSAQCLYFHLNMRADDDGFIGNPKKIMRIVGAKDDDLNVLISKRFVLVYENGVMVIKHWRMHNTLSNTRYHETQYQDEKSMLLLKSNGAYSFNSGIPIDDTKYIDMHNSQCGGQVADNRRINDGQVADSVLDLDLDKDIDKDLETKGGTKRKRFVKPTLEELEAYKREKDLNVNCEHFLDFYESKGWMIGKNHMKDWKATMRGWSSREKEQHRQPSTNKLHNFDERKEDLDALLAGGIFKHDSV